MIRNGEAFAETVKNKPGMKMQESLKCEREMENRTVWAACNQL